MLYSSLKHLFIINALTRTKDYKVVSDLLRCGTVPRIVKFSRLRALNYWRAQSAVDRWAAWASASSVPGLIRRAGECALLR